ncbi:MAG: hypothetical protein JSU87_14055 [Gemmatimonadota bacterium]|nr:MAG: hypothetical protein JSU87_14055 [Gemmatimonadota bacterium]
MQARFHKFVRFLPAAIVFVVLASCEELPDAASTHEPRGLTGLRPDLVSVAPGEMQSPVRIAQDKQGRLYVSDYQSQSVVMLDAGGGGVFVAAAFTVPGNPLGIEWAKGNLLLVGNATTRTVDVYRTTNGKWFYSLGGVGAIGDPSDIAADSDRDLAFVVDGEAFAVKVFDLRNGALLYTISGPGPGSYYLQNPTAIALDPSRGEVLVSDFGDPAVSGSPPSVKIYTYEGDHVKTLSGKSGMLGQKFSRPQGLAVDALGRILLVDAVAGEVLVLDRQTGNVLETYGTLGSGPGELWLPLDLVVDDNQMLYVTNNRPRRVEVFSLGG